MKDALLVDKTLLLLERYKAEISAATPQIIYYLKETFSVMKNQSSSLILILKTYV